MNIGKIVDQIKTVNVCRPFQFDDKLSLSKEECDSVLAVRIVNNTCTRVQRYGKNYYAYGYAYIVGKKCLKMSVEYFAEANHILGYYAYLDCKENYESHLVNGGNNYEYYLLPIKPSYKKLTWKVNQ